MAIVYAFAFRHADAASQVLRASDIATRELFIDVADYTMRDNTVARVSFAGDDILLASFTLMLLAILLMPACYTPCAIVATAALRYDILLCAHDASDFFFSPYARHAAGYDADTCCAPLIDAAHTFHTALLLAPCCQRRALLIHAYALMPPPVFFIFMPLQARCCHVAYAAMLHYAFAADAAMLPCAYMLLFSYAYYTVERATRCLYASRYVIACLCFHFAAATLRAIC